MKHFALALAFVLIGSVSCRADPWDNGIVYDPMMILTIVEGQGCVCLPP